MLDKRLKFPKYGIGLLIGILMLIYGNFAMQFVNVYKIGKKVGLGVGDIIISSLGYLFQNTIMGTIHYLCVLFLTAWIENFCLKVNPNLIDALQISIRNCITNIFRINGIVSTICLGGGGYSFAGHPLLVTRRIFNLR